MAYIYCITNLTNGKRYVGKSHIEGDDVRWLQHKKDLINGRHHNSHLLAAWRLAGPECFEFSILERCSDDDANAKEIYWIAFYGCTNKLTGYNMTHGGDGGRHTEESRQKISAANSGKQKSLETRLKLSAAKLGKKTGKRPEEVGLKISNALKGRVPSKETKAKISEAHLGKTISESQRKGLETGWYGGNTTIKCITDGKSFPSMSAAAAHYSLDQGKVSLVCAGKRSHTGGLVFRKDPC